MARADGKAFEYPDEAGYPDGMGFLDEGTALVDDGAAEPQGEIPPDHDSR